MKKYLILLIFLTGCVSTKVDTSTFLKSVEELKTAQRQNTDLILKTLSKNDSTFKKLLNNAYQSSDKTYPISDADLLKLLNGTGADPKRKEN